MKIYGTKNFYGTKKFVFFQKNFLKIFKKCIFCAKKWAFVPFLSRILSHKKLVKNGKNSLKMVKNGCF